MFHRDIQTPRGELEIRRSAEHFNLVPRAFPLKVGGGEKTLASAGHVSILHPKILGVING